MAKKIVLDAKTDYPAACNAMVILVDVSKSIMLSNVNNLVFHLIHFHIIFIVELACCKVTRFILIMFDLEHNSFVFVRKHF